MSWRLEKLKSAPKSRALLFRLGAIVFGLLIAGAVLGVLGFDPLAMATQALGYTLGSSFGLQDLGYHGCKPSKQERRDQGAKILKTKGRSQ
ncbi:MAG: hypothetical protein AAGL89_16915, partial [Pseudomonadota bacterium]